MVRAVLPRATSQSAWLLTGYTACVPCSAGRAPPLVEEAASEAEEGLDEDDDNDDSIGDNESDASCGEA